MTRRGHKEGTYTPLPSGRIRWRVWVEVRGKLERRGGTADTEKKARDAVRKLLEAAEGGKAPTRSLITFGEYVDAWVKDRGGLAEKTKDMYAAHIRRDIVPGLGAFKLREITPMLLREFLTALRDVRNLSYNSRRQIHIVLMGALKQAVTDGMLPSNPAAAPGVRPVAERSASAELAAYTREEAWFYLRAARDGHNRPGAVLALLMLTGMRKGEALALKWEAVKLEGATPFLEVRGTRSQSGGRVYENEHGKTESARRRVPITTEVVELLKSVRDETRESSKMLEVLPSPYVFSKLQGGSGPYRPDNLDRVHTEVCKRGAVRRLPIHALRHTYASLMAAQGMRIEVLSRILGHRDPAFTLRQYRHLYPEEMEAVSLSLPEPSQDAQQKRKKEGAQSVWDTFGTRDEEKAPSSPPLKS